MCLYLSGSRGNRDTYGKAFEKNGMPYGVEVVGDPWDVFAPGAVRHPLRVYFRYRGTHDLKQTVAQANAALYVTEYQLQKALSDK